VGVTHSFAKASEGRQPARGLAALQPAVYELCGLVVGALFPPYRRGAPESVPEEAGTDREGGKLPGLEILLDVLTLQPRKSDG